MSFPTARVLAFLREDCLRFPNGKARTKKEDQMRVIALFREGVAADAPPVFFREFDDGESAEGVLDVDELVARMQRKVDTEMQGQTRPKALMFRINVVHGREKSIIATNVTATFPFTVHPTKTVTRGSNAFMQSEEGATEEGFAAFAMRTMEGTVSLFMPEIQNLIQEKNETIDQLRADNRALTAENAQLRREVNEAEDRKIERTIKLRDAAVKQRLKEKGGRMAISAFSMLASSFITSKMGGGNGGPPPMGPGSPPPQNLPPNPHSPGSLPEGPPAAIGEGPGPAAAPPSAGSASSPTSTGEPEMDIVDRAGMLAMKEEPWEHLLGPVFGVFVEEVGPHIADLGSVLSPEQHVIAVQMAQKYVAGHGLDRLLLQSFAEDINQDDPNQLRKLQQRMPSPRAVKALALLLMAAKATYDRDMDDAREVENDITLRVDRARNGVVVDADPIVPTDNISEIRVSTPRVVTQNEHAEMQKKKAAIEEAARAAALQAQGRKPL